MNNLEKIKTIIGVLYIKQKMSNYNNILNNKEQKSLNIFLNELSNFNLNNLSDKNINTLQNFILENLNKKFMFLKNAHSAYYKISYKNIFEYSIEGFFHNYKENELNKINKNDIEQSILLCKKIFNENNNHDIKYNVSNRIEKLSNKSTFDKDSGLFFAKTTDLFEFISYGTQITIGIVDDIINNSNEQLDYSSNYFEFNFNQIYIAKNFDLCNEQILCSLIKTITSLEKFKNKYYERAMERLKQNLSLYDNSIKSIELLENLPNIVNKCSSKEELIKRLNNLYPQSQDYDYIFNSNEFINRYRKELGINETVEESQFKLIPSEFLEYISTSKEKEVQEFYKDFCEYFKISYEPLITYPIDTSKTVSIKKAKNIIEKLFRFEDKYELDPYYKITIPPYSSEQVQKIKELDEMNRKNPQNEFNILTILNPQLTPHLMDKIAELEKYKPYSSIPIRNIKLSDDQINDLSDLIKNNEDVWHIRTSDIKIANITKNKETKSIEIDYSKEQSQNIEHNLNIEEIR